MEHKAATVAFYLPVSYVCNTFWLSLGQFSLGQKLVVCARYALVFHFTLFYAVILPQRATIMDSERADHYQCRQCRNELLIFQSSTLYLLRVLMWKNLQVKSQRRIRGGVFVKSPCFYPHIRKNMFIDSIYRIHYKWSAQYILFNCKA